MDNTLIDFPVSKYLPLIGEVDGIEGVFEGNEKAVASWNSLKIMYTYKQVYTAKNNFKFIDKTGNIIHGELLFDFFKAF